MVSDKEMAPRERLLSGARPTNRLEAPCGRHQFDTPIRESGGILGSSSRASPGKTYRLSASVWRLRLSSGEQSHSFGEYVPGGVQVSIVLSPTITDPRPVRERHVHINLAALGAELCGREEASDPDAALQAPRGLVFDLAQELTEGSVQDRTGQLGFRKSLRVQILDADAIVLPRQVGRQLVEEVVSLIGHLAMHTSYAALSLLSATAIRLLSREVLLRPPKPPLGPPREVRSRDTLAIGENEQVFDPEIYSDRVSRSWRPCVGHLEHGSQGDVPMSCPIPLEGRAHGRSFEFARLTYAHPSNFHHIHLALLHSNLLRYTKNKLSNFLLSQPLKTSTLL